MAIAVDEARLKVADEFLLALRLADPEAYSRRSDRVMSRLRVLSGPSFRPDTEEDYRDYALMLQLDVAAADDFDRMRQWDEDFKTEFGYYPFEEEPQESLK